MLMLTVSIIKVKRILKYIVKLLHQRIKQLSKGRFNLLRIKKIDQHLRTKMLLI